MMNMRSSLAVLMCSLACSGCSAAAVGATTQGSEAGGVATRGGRDLLRSRVHSFTASEAVASRADQPGGVSPSETTASPLLASPRAASRAASPAGKVGGAARSEAATSPEEPDDAREVVTETELGVTLFSEPLDNGLFNPMPGGIVGGYRADTGLDIAGFHMPVYAIAPGTLEYSEPGHTRWSSDDNAVRLRLDEPIDVVQRLPDGAGKRRTRVTHVWYAHLHRLRFLQRSGSRHPRRVKGGELLGISGTANRSPHLHLGLLLDGVVDQRWGSYLLDDEVRHLMGGWRLGQRLPKASASAR